MRTSRLDFLFRNSFEDNPPQSKKIESFLCIVFLMGQKGLNIRQRNMFYFLHTFNLDQLTFFVTITLTLIFPPCFHQVALGKARTVHTSLEICIWRRKLKSFLENHNLRTKERQVIQALPLKSRDCFGNNFSYWLELSKYWIVIRLLPWWALSPETWHEQSFLLYKIIINLYGKVDFYHWQQWAH